MRHLSIHGELPPVFKFRVRYLIYRFGDVALGDFRAPAHLATEISRSLEVGLGDVDRVELKELSRKLTGSETEPLRRAELLLSGVRDEPGSEEQRARLLVDLLRSSNTPARLVCGHRLDRSSGSAPRVLSPHFWAEFFVPGAGWLPADPCCRPTEPGAPFSIGLDHVVRGRGQDLLLQPVQRGSRVPCFWQTYAELDGRPHHVSSELTLGRHEMPGRLPHLAPGAVSAGLAELFRVELQSMDKGPHRHRLPAGGTLSLASSRDQWLFLLLEGQLRISRLTPSGRKLELAVHRAPAMFLGTRLLRGLGEALEDSLLLALSREDVEEIGRSRPQFTSLLLDTLVERLLESDERMEYLAYHSLAARIAMALLKLADDHGAISGITHQVIADMVGAYRETVTKVLHQLKRAGYLRLATRRIEITDALGLTKMLEG
jgi:CRP-like cAMP-binding protein